VAGRLAALTLAAVVTSPLERCVQTAREITKAQRTAGRTPQTKTDRRIVECDYGDWTGREIKELAKEPLWKVVQSTPSAVTFPGGEAMAAMAARAVSAIRQLDVAMGAAHGADAVWVACSHADVIKSIVADALGMHLDLFQRIVVDPCSVSAIRYLAGRPFVLATNDSGPDLTRLGPPKGSPKRRRAASATVGGGAGGGAI